MIVSMKEDTHVIPPGIIVCPNYSVGDEMLYFNSNIDENTGRVVDGVLVLFDTESVFDIHHS